MSTYRQKRGNSRRTAAGKRRKKRGGKSTAFSGNVYIKCGILILTILTLILAVRGFLSRGGGHVNVDASEPDIDVQLLDVNPYSRPGIESNGITGIVIHYTANPGSTAQENRDYFNGLQYSQETSASSNFIVGLAGEIIQCVPT